MKSFAARPDRERYYNPAPVSAYLTQFEITVKLTVPGTHTYIYICYTLTFFAVRFGCHLSHFPEEERERERECRWKDVKTGYEAETKGVGEANLIKLPGVLLLLYPPPPKIPIPSLSFPASHTYTRQSEYLE